MGASSPLVVLTRAHADNVALVAWLGAAGVAVLEIPTADVRDVPVEPDLDAVRVWLSHARAVAFTSRHGVHSFVRQLGAEILRRPGLTVAAVGDATAEALLQEGAFVGVQVREPATGRQLAKALAQALPGGSTIVVVQPRHAQRDLPTDLLAQGYDVRQAVVYENVPPPDPESAVHAHASADAVVFAAAPSAVARLLGWSAAWRQARWVAIGSTTAAALTDAEIAAAAVCARPDLETCFATIMALLSEKTAACPQFN